MTVSTETKIKDGRATGEDRTVAGAAHGTDAPKAEAFLYYWDDPDDVEHRGWWLAPGVGSDEYFAACLVPKKKARYTQNTRTGEPQAAAQYCACAPRLRPAHMIRLLNACTCVCVCVAQDKCKDWRKDGRAMDISVASATCMCAAVPTCSHPNG